MYTRLLTCPNHSFYLFGPRGVGKTTWLRQALPNALWFNLLREAEYLPLLQDLEANFRAKALSLAKDGWVVIDEVQRLPELLREVHDLISLPGNTIRFALSGSSARKLRRMNVDLLAGRAVTRHMAPLCFAELGPEADVSKMLEVGSLPDVWRYPDQAVSILEAYAGTYLKEEIKQEALVKELGSFVRFLKIAALLNGQVISMSGVARDAAVHRSTAQRYFDVLVDTLIGHWLPGWQPRVKVRERLEPKFYLFDCGVQRALAQTLRDRLSDYEKGPLLETLVYQELRSAISYLDIGGEIFYWRTPAGVEVDFIWSRGKRAVAIEVKAVKQWRREYLAGIRALLDGGAIAKGYVVYLGADRLNFDGIEALPAGLFFAQLMEGKIL